MILFCRVREKSLILCEGIVKSIRETVSQPIAWSGRWEYELRAGAFVIGTLRIKEKSGIRAVAETSEGRWVFRRMWWPVAKVRIQPVDSGFDIGVLKHRWLERRSSLEFPYGQVFFWVPIDLWETECVFTTRYGDPLLCFKRHSNPFITLMSGPGNSRGKMMIEVPAFGMPELPLLTMLGCYLMVIESM